MISVAPNKLPFASNDLGFDQKSAHFDIDTGSIYGFDQILHRQPSSNKLDQAAIARNFSKRTLCLNTITQNEELTAINQNTDEPQMQIGKPLRWFESGSVASIHLGSSLEIFKEPPITTASVADERKSSIFAPWRRQSQNIVHVLTQFRKTSRRTSHFVISENESIKSIPSQSGKVHKDLENNLPTEQSATNQTDGCCCNFFRWFVRFFDLALLRDNIYLNIMVGMAISVFRFVILN